MDEIADRSAFEKIWERMRSSGRLPGWSFLLIAAVITTLHLLSDWMPGYRADTDEACQLHASVRAWQGMGFTTDKDDDLADLSDPEFDYLSSWPPLYGLMFLGFLKATGSLGHALVGLKIVKAGAAMIGSMGWMRLAVKHLPPTASLVFALGLASSFYGALINPITSNPTNLLVWAILPFQFLLLQGALTDRGAAWTFAAGLPAAAAIGIRYSGVFLIPTLGLAMLLWSHGSMLRRFLRGALLTSAPVLMLLGIMIANKLLTGHPLRPENDEFALRWDRLADSTPVKFVLAWGVGLEDMVLRIRPSFKQVSFLYFLPGYALLAVLLFGSAWAARKKLSPDGAGMVGLAVLGGAWLVGLLAFVSLTTAETLDYPEWSALGWDRYYSEFAPMVLLAWLIILTAAAPEKPGWNFATIAPTLVTALCVVGFTYGAMRIARRSINDTANLLKDPSPSQAVERKLLEMISQSPVPHHVVIDSPTATLRNIRWMPGVRATDDWTRHRLPKSGTSRPIYVLLVVRRLWNPKTQAAEDSWETVYSEHYRQFFKVPKVATVRDDTSECDIHAGVIEPYKKGRIRPPVR